MIFPKHLPLISLKDTVIFPQTIISIYINSTISQKLVQEAFSSHKLLFLSCLENPEENSKKVYKIGCVGFIMKVKSENKACLKILVQGLKKASITSVKDEHVFLNYFSNPEVELSETDKQALGKIKSSLEPLSQLKESFSPEILAVLNSVKNPNQFCDMLINNLDLKAKILQKALEIGSTEKKIEFTRKIIQDELEISKLKGRLQKLIKNEVSKPLLPSPRDFKSQQWSNCKKEEVREYTQNLESLNLPKEVNNEAFKQLSRLEKMHTESSEASIIRNYLDWILELPWNELSEDNLDLKHAQKVLDEDHLGLQKIKERILEFLAVCYLKRNSSKGPILCFAGPPGVGKTSLGKSIAKSLGRAYHRISLGGLKDEAEIRGHRRTYVGAMPGKIIQALKHCGTKNPVIVLDEIDKLCFDFKGDPSSALLEVLDPEQNQAFRDHYLNLDFDLSQIFFIATANLVHNVPPALKDRLEVINLSGYTLEEKKQIAVKHLTSKELANNGLPKDHIELDESALSFLIQSYTKEAGLRNLSRQLASLCRKAAKKFVLGEKKKLILNEKQIMNMLGCPYFHPEENLKSAQVGIATGLAWTEAGGETLSIETLRIKGKKSSLILTGKLGEVMKESAQASLSYVKSYVQKLNLKIEESFFDHSEIHIHLPGGAVPKDGPSAGVALASTLFSLVTNIPIKNTLAMTGEITLSGRVLPVGGIKEKVLAAFNNGIKTVILPKKNTKDLDEIPEKIRKGLTFVLVSNLEEVFKEVLLFEPSKQSPVLDYLENKELEGVA
ncbi:MAG: endopeptidase La [Oligoflexia bacterium]|nr:endopeptidase La [Oligoflexia bacterium]